MEYDENAYLLDLGCNDGRWTKKMAGEINTKNIYGIDIVEGALKKSKKRGIKVKKSDLNNKFPFDDNFFDVVHANQVIEHLINVDCFIDEIKRVLKPNGYCIISTENLSSIDNLLAMFLGQQAFSQHISEKYHLGNKFSPHHGEPMKFKFLVHRTIFSYFGLQDIFKHYGFRIDKVLASGFFPLPNFLSKIDKIHSHFITVKLRKLS